MRKVEIAPEARWGYREAADIKGLRDRAAIGIMAYTFGRVSAIVGLRLGDYRLDGKRTCLRLMEKGNKEKLVWLHREAEEHLAAYCRRRSYRRSFRSHFPDTGQGTPPVWSCHEQAGHAASREAAMPRFGSLGRFLQPYIPRYRDYRIPPQRRGARSGAGYGKPFRPSHHKLYDRRKDLATLSEIERRIAFE